MTTYYVLFTKDESNRWWPQFGDHKRSIVKFEYDDYRRSYKASQLRIVAVEDSSTAAIDIARLKLNNE
jgi:hypothetical protein